MKSRNLSERLTMVPVLLLSVMKIYNSMRVSLIRMNNEALSGKGTRWVCAVQKPWGAVIYLVDVSTD